MCVIVHKINQIKEDDIADAHFYNPDGFGLMFQDEGRVIAHKGIYEIEDILRILYPLRDREYIAHFRIATVGEVNDKNCHPFYCGSQTWMMHNGTLNIETPNKGRSDTWHLAKFLRTVKITRKLIDYLPDFVGDNRLALMNRKETKLIGDWEWFEGNYWSNLRWLEYNFNPSIQDDYIPFWVSDEDYDEDLRGMFLKC